MREADLLRKKNKEIKEAKRKLEFGDRDTKKPKHDHGHKSNECPNPKVIEAKPLKSIKKEKVEKAGVSNLKAHVPMLGKSVIVFIDDILVYSKSKEKHEVHLREVLRLIWLKIEAVMNWQAPKSVGEIQSFLGTEDMVVYSDASYFGLECVLVQQGKVIAYALSRLKKIQAAQIEALKEDDSRGIKTRQGRIYIPFRSNVKELLLEEVYKSRYSIHSGATKMYLDSKKNYWWLGMKRDYVKCVEKCLTCLKVKAEHQNPYGKIQALEIPVWKWEKITMNFITKLPKTTKKHDAIWVIVDRLTKSAHFIPIQENMLVHKLAKIYVNEIVARHEVPISIVSD
ncbi:putative reverse transcriptase domain-containing protein [Tanacetum coccineum]